MALTIWLNNFVWAVAIIASLIFYDVAGQNSGNDDVNASIIGLNTKATNYIDLNSSSGIITIDGRNISVDPNDTTGVADSAFSSSSPPTLNCSGPGLREAFIDYATENSPKYSNAWNRTYTMLQKAKQNGSYALIVMVGFDGVKNRIREMLEAYGIEVHSFDEPEWEFNSYYKAGRDVVIEMSFFSAISGWGKSGLYIKEGEETKHNRIIVQSEQLNGRYGGQMKSFLKNKCDNVETCAIWEYSDFHMDMLQDFGIRHSAILLPMMTQSTHFPSTVSRRRKLLVGEEAPSLYNQPQQQQPQQQQQQQQRLQEKRLRSGVPVLALASSYDMSMSSSASKSYLNVQRLYHYDHPSHRLILESLPKGKAAHVTSTFDTSPYNATQALIEQKQLFQRDFHISPLISRKHDIVFYASMNPRDLPRRITFYNEISKEGFSGLVYAMSNNQRQIRDDYDTSKVCFCLHVSNAESAGEYHRLSDVVHAGCVPLFESFADQVGRELYTECGGVHFGKYDQLINRSHALVDSIKADVDNIWTERAFHAAIWWQKQFSEINKLLLDIFTE